MNLNDIVKGIEAGYIFGGAAVAKRILKLIGNKEQEKIKGFIVSRLEDNPDQIEGKPVISIDDSSIDKNATIFVTVSESYHPEVYRELEEQGFKHIVSAIRFYGLETEHAETNAVSTESLSKNIDEKTKLCESLKKFRDDLVADYISSKHAFGENRFYQSLPKLGIKGERPTDLRIEVYQLGKYLTPDSKVLDIGCNAGFLDIEISEHVRHVIGLEYNSTLSNVGKKTAATLGITNVEFVCADYNEWEKDNEETFDLVFSFAVHIWLDVTPLVYAEQMNHLLNRGGHLIFESQTYITDKLFQDFVNAFVQKGFMIAEEGMIMDDGITERKFVVFQKTE